MPYAKFWHARWTDDDKNKLEHFHSAPCHYRRHGVHTVQKQKKCDAVLAINKMTPEDRADLFVRYPPKDASDVADI
jgi:hypothetical protein